jgi:hypothetical protein
MLNIIRSNINIRLVYNLKLLLRIIWQFGRKYTKEPRHIGSEAPTNEKTLYER